MQFSGLTTTTVLALKGTLTFHRQERRGINPHSALLLLKGLWGDQFSGAGQGEGDPARIHGKTAGGRHPETMLASSSNLSDLK